MFVSSTYHDLTEERLEVIKALLELDCIPCGMEYFPAASEETWNYIQNLIDGCDYYVLIVGGRYGSMTASGVSYTRREYEYALAKGLPVIAFLHGSPEDLPAKKTEQSSGGRKKLEEFITLVRKHLCKDWSTADQLGAVVSRSLTQLIKRHPRTGWVKADALASSEATEEILGLTRQVKDLQIQLAVLQAKPPEGSELLAQDTDVVTLQFWYDVVDSSKARNKIDYNLGRETGRFELTWNKIFARVAPVVALQASETSVKNAIVRLINDKFDWSWDALPPNAEVTNITLAKETVNLLRIQLVALGLITVERGEYSAIPQWGLTKLGRDKMFAVVSVKRAENKSTPKTTTRKNGTRKRAV
ncbi:MAG: hypothetical protein QOJ45_1676 [Verrucomicrobiota bacterium]